MRALVRECSLSGGGGGGGGGVESELSGREENTFGRLGESVGARLRGREEAWRELGGRGELHGAETLRAWKARGVQGAYSVCACAVRSAWARPLCARSSAVSDRALACGSRVRSEALASTRGKCASVSPRTRV